MDSRKRRALQRQADWLQSRLDESTGPTRAASRDLDPRLHQYQVRAVQHLWDHPRSALFMEMSLGKTAVVLQALTPEHLPALAVAPKRVAERVWPTEGRKWRPDLRVVSASGTPKQRARALASGADVVSIGREHLDSVDTSQYRTVILDELTGYKNHRTARFKTAAEKTRDSDHVWGLTGTPSPNGYLDLWSQLYLLDRGYRLGKKITTYRSRYFEQGRRLPNGVVIDWKLKDGAAQEIEGQIADLCLSMRTEDYLELPPLVKNRVEIDLPGPVAEIYRSMDKKKVAKVGERDFSADSRGTALNRMAQICAGFLYPDTEDYEDRSTEWLHDEKIRAVSEVVEATPSPVLVLYRYRAELERLQAAIPGAKQIGDPGVLDDWDAGRVPALLAQPASVGHGLNLQSGGHTMVWSSLPWSLEEYDQTMARLARQGQEHPVVAHYVMVPGSIDDHILDALESKSDVQEHLMRVLGGPI